MFKSSFIRTGTAIVVDGVFRWENGFADEVRVTRFRLALDRLTLAEAIGKLRRIRTDACSRAGGVPGQCLTPRCRRQSADMISGAAAGDPAQLIAPELCIVRSLITLDRVSGIR